MELSEQLRRRNLLLSVTWRPRDENEEADALTNENFGGFNEALRINFEWKDLEFLVLPRLTQAAEALFEEMRAERRASRQASAARLAKPARKRLRDRDPW